MPRSTLLASGLAIDDDIAQSIDAQLDPEGSGAPTIAGYLGQRYWRLDTPGTTNQRLYVCTVAGVAGSATWVGIL
jgi:hypothetical protein